MVYSSIYPMSSEDYGDLTKALDKLKLNDAALTFTKVSSAALGFGFRCGFLGLLHLDIVQERLEREFGMSLLLSAPTVQYDVTLTNGEEVVVDNPSFFPDAGDVERVEEPYIKASIMIPEKFLGAVMELCREQRGEKTQFD